LEQELRIMSLNDKADHLKMFGLSKLVEELTNTEAEYEKLLREQKDFRSLNMDNLSGARGTDSIRVGTIRAQLSGQIPTEINGKKATEADKKSWLERQETENKEFADAIRDQRMAGIVLGDFDVRIKVMELHFQNTRSIISIRIAQVNFFSAANYHLIKTEEVKS
jgi:hypothetical protein